MAIGDKNVYFLAPHFKFISKKLIDDELIKTDEDSVDLFNYLESNCEKDTFTKVHFLKFIQNMINNNNICNLINGCKSRRILRKNKIY